MKVTLLFFDGPNWQTTNDNLEALAIEFGFRFDRHHVETEEDAQRLQFRGSPTVLIDGRDILVMLNFDMIGSPNFARYVYDGDGADYGPFIADGIPAGGLFTGAEAPRGLAPALCSSVSAIA